MQKKYHSNKVVKKIFMDKIKQIAKITAYGVNYLFHPILMPVYLFAAITLYSSLLMNNTMDTKLYILKTVSLISLATPLLSIGISKLAVRLIGERTSNNYDNTLTSIVLVISYLAAIVVLKDILTLRMALRLLIAPIFIVAFYSIFRYVEIKASIWIAGMSALTAFLFLFSLYGVRNLEGLLFASILMSGIVGSSRMYLEKDELSEIGLGYTLGIAAAFFSFFIGGIF